MTSSPELCDLLEDVFRIICEHHRLTKKKPLRRSCTSKTEPQSFSLTATGAFSEESTSFLKLDADHGPADAASFIPINNLSSYPSLSPSKNQFSSTIPLLKARRLTTSHANKHLFISSGRGLLRPISPLRFPSILFPRRRHRPHNFSSYKLVFIGEDFRRRQESERRLFLSREEDARTRLHCVEMAERDSFVDPLWQERALLLQEEFFASEKAKGMALAQRREEEELAGWLMQVVLQEMRDIMAEQEGEWEELVCYFRFVGRMILDKGAVMANVREKRRKEKLKESNEGEMRDFKRFERAKELKRIHRCREEGSRRAFLMEKQAAIASAIAEVFIERLKQLKEIEDQKARAWKQKEQRRQEIVQAFVQLLELEEAQREAAKQRWVAFMESMQFQATGNFTNAMELHLIRIKRELAECEQLEIEEISARKEFICTYEYEIEGFFAEKIISLAAVIKGERHRKLREYCRKISDRCEKVEQELMFVHDNASWELLRWNFIDNLDLSFLLEEKMERFTFIEREHDERAFIRGQLLVRGYLVHASYRERDEIRKEEHESYMGIVNLLRDDQDRFSLVWYEAVRRLMIVEESNDDQKEFQECSEVLAKLTRTVSEFKCSKTGRLLTNVQTLYMLKLRETTIPWFYGSEGCSFLDGAELFLKENSNKPLRTVTMMDICVELLNPQTGDDIIMAEKEEDIFFRTPHGEYVSSADNESKESSDIFLKIIHNSSLNNEGGTLCTPRGLPSTSPKTTLTLTYTGLLSDLFAGIKFQNTSQPYKPMRLIQWVVRFTVAGVSSIIYIKAFPAIFSIPGRLVALSSLTPLSEYTPPPFKMFDKVHLSMEITTNKEDFRIYFKLPARFYKGQNSNNISFNGRIIMQVYRQETGCVEFSFDNVSASIANVRSLLSAIKVVKNEGAGPLKPIAIHLIMSRRGDGGQRFPLEFKQLLDVDATLLNTPVLHVPSMDISCRISFSPITDISTKEWEQYMNKIPFSFLLRASVVFPTLQTVFVGGGVVLDMQNDVNQTCEFSIRRLRMEDYQFEVHDSFLLCYDELTSEPRSIGRIYGDGTNSLTIRFNSDTECSILYFDALLHSIGFVCRDDTFAVTMKKILNLSLTIDVRVDQSAKLIMANFNLCILPPIVKMKSSYLNYVEECGWKTFPTMTVKPLSSIFTPEARIELKMVEGFEKDDSDELCVLESVPDSQDSSRQWIYDARDKPIAFWNKKGKTDLTIQLSPKVYGWLRESIRDTYSHHAFNFPPVSASAVEYVLRSIAYRSVSHNSQLLKKLFIMIVDDGVTGPMVTPLTVQIESVDDATDIILSAETICYNQFTRPTLKGVQLMPGVRLEDVDSDNFHGGYIVVEYFVGPIDSGEELFILPPSRQEELIHKSQGTTSVSVLSTLFHSRVGGRHFVEENLYGNTLLGPPEPVSPYLSMVAKEAPLKVLVVKNRNKLFYCGQQIGTVTFERKPTKEVTLLSFNFMSEKKFVSFPTAEYVMRCVGYVNETHKATAEPCVYAVRLSCTGLKSTIESRAKITIDCHPSAIVLPPYAEKLQYETEIAPLRLFKGAHFNLQNVVANKGYFSVSIIQPIDHTDRLLLLEGKLGGERKVTGTSSAAVVKVKGDRVLVGNDEVGLIVSQGVMSDPSKGKDYLECNSMNKVTFTLQFLKTKLSLLEPMLRAVAYNNVSNHSLPVDLRNRHVEVELSCNGKSEEASLRTLSIEMPSKGISYSWITSSTTAVDYRLHACQLEPFMRKIQLNDNTEKGFHAGMTFTAVIVKGVEKMEGHAPLTEAGEYLCVVPTAAIEFTFAEEDEKVFLNFRHEGNFLAVVGKPLSLMSDICLYERTVTMILLEETSAEHLTTLFETWHYLNKGDMVREGGDTRVINLLMFKDKDDVTPIAETMLTFHLIE